MKFLFKKNVPKLTKAVNALSKLFMYNFLKHGSWFGSVMKREVTQHAQDALKNHMHK